MKVVSSEIRISCFSQNSILTTHIFHCLLCPSGHGRYKKVWVSYSDFSSFVVGYAYQLICQVSPWLLLGSAMAGDTFAVGALMSWNPDLSKSTPSSRFFSMDFIKC